MIQEREVRERLSALVAHEVSLASFERWLNEVSQEMFSDSDECAMRLVAAASLLISEQHDAIISDSEMRQQLSAILNASAESSTGYAI